MRFYNWWSVRLGIEASVAGIWNSPVEKKEEEKHEIRDDNMKW